MKRFRRVILSFLLLLTLLSNTLPCGPGYVTPLFDTTSAPENPYSDYAAGKLGIIKPTFRRSVLFAAYRYIASSGLNAAEQQAVADVWNADIKNQDFKDSSIDEVVNAWVERRKEVVGKDEKTPDIYTDRSSGNYSFFPNCAKNAFETAAETLADRSSAHGPSDPNVVNWVKAQDQVFENCASGRQTPDDLPVGAPEWLQKDRAYQKAAAEFYSLDYEAAKKHFAEIAQDTDSPWQETADYLVARTLIREASLTKASERSNSLYDEADAHLQRFVSSSGKFSSSAEKLEGLIKFRRHPEERVTELAKKLSGVDDNFRQDLIDYTWLLDKFESEVLAAEQKRKEEEAAKKNPNANLVSTSNANSVDTANVPPGANSNANASSSARKNDSDITINLWNEDYKQNWTIYVDRNATDDEALTAAEKVVGAPLTEEMKKRVREQRRNGYASGFTENQNTGYEGRYYGEEKLQRSLLPAYLRQDDLTDWLYTYQMEGAETYLYALSKYKAGGSELWLMTALAKADKSSTNLPRLLEAANNVSRTSPAYPTIAYHTVRILFEQGKQSEARKLVDDILNTGDQMPISAQNAFLAFKLRLAETLEDFLKYSLRRPFAFDFDGETGTIDEFIAEQKKWYDPQNNDNKTREAYEAEIEDQFKTEKEWQDRSMFDTDTIEVMNQHFPTSVLLQVESSPALPDYMRERFAIAIWTRAYLLDDMATLLRITPELAKYRPDLAPELEHVTAAKTQAALDHAVLYFVLKNPLMSPYLEDGMGKTDNEQGQFDANDWWCGPYEGENDETSGGDVPRQPRPRLAFLTNAQSQSAQMEQKKLKDAGDAPKFLADKVIEWAKQYPADRRLPEVLYIAIEANGWTKYGCGNNEDLHNDLVAYLKKHYPNSEWTAKIIEEESNK